MNILITGTSSGMGNALAKIYLEKGNIVFGISRHYNHNLSGYPNYNHLSLDLMDENIGGEIRGFFKNTKILDLVVLNAGILPPVNDLKSTMMSDINKVMRVNVWANKEIIDTLSEISEEIKQIVAVSSGAAVSGARGWNVYSISKAALNMMISLYSKEMPDIHFTALAPGVIDTGMQEYIYGLPEEKHFPVVKRLREMRDSGEMLSPEEAVKNLVRVFPLLKRYKSGEFLDVRDI